MFENIKKIISKTKEEKVSKVKFYNLDDELFGKLITVCLLLSDNNEILARGVSICSIKDTFNKTTGRNKSYGRAMKALKNKSDFYRIARDFCSDESCSKSFKVKKDDQERISLLEEYFSLYGNTTNTIEKKNLLVYNFIFPLSYPVSIAAQSFELESEYIPIPTDYELSIGLIRKNLK